MMLIEPSFDRPVTRCEINYGRGCIDSLGEKLEDYGLNRALVVCGSNVGANRPLMDAVKAGLGAKCWGVFAETSSAKDLETAYDGLARMRDEEIDAIVSVGGGSSHDVAKFMKFLNTDYRPIEEVQAEVAEDGSVAPPSDTTEGTTHVAVPTTFAGADFSDVAGIMVPVDGDRVGVAVRSDFLSPRAVFFDPNLFETTPPNALVGSAMNGFDKGVEALYARPDPVSDAVAVRGLEYYRASLPDIRDPPDERTMDQAVIGTILVQLPSQRASIVHAFGHALRRCFGVQQGVAHAVILPHTLEFLYDRVDGRRDLLAQALGGETILSDPEATILEVVTKVRDAMELPSRLRDLDAVTEAGLGDAAELTHGDPLMAATPTGFDPSVADLEDVLRAAW